MRFRSKRIEGKGKRGRRGSVLIVSAVLMVVAGFSTASWIAFVTQSQHSAARDRERLAAFYAAEAGVEQIVDYFNNPLNLPDSAIPDDYGEEFSSSGPIMGWNVHPAPYSLFEPYWEVIDTNNQWVPVDLAGNVVCDPSTRELLDPNNPPFVRVKSYFRTIGGVKKSKIPTCELILDDLEKLTFIDEEGQELGRVTRILLINPEDFPAYGLPLPAEEEKVVCKVVSTAVTPRGISISVESLIRENPTLNIASPGAIISWDSAAFSGQFNVHWGEIWTKTNVNLKNNWQNGNNGVPSETQDRWFKFRTQGVFKNSQGTMHTNGAVSGGYSSTAVASAAANYYQPYLRSTLHANNNQFRNYENLYQHNTLEFPEFDYHKWKKFFLQYDLPYYFTDASGTIYGREGGAWVGKSYDEWFAVAVDDPNYNNPLKMAAFIDSIPTDANGVKWTASDGFETLGTRFFSREPDRINGSNMADIRSSGNSIHTRGAMLMAANYDTSGGGSPPQSTDVPGVYKPDGSDPNNFRVNHNGLLYLYGKVKGTGNLTVFGSIFAESGYTGTGAREVYYNNRMKDGSWLNINQSRVTRSLWNVKRGDTVAVESEV